MAKKIKEVKVQNRGEVPFSLLDGTAEITVNPAQEVTLHGSPQNIEGQNYKHRHIFFVEVDAPDEEVKEKIIEKKVVKPKPKPKKKRKTYRRTKE